MTEKNKRNSWVHPLVESIGSPTNENWLFYIQIVSKKETKFLEFIFLNKRI